LTTREIFWPGITLSLDRFRPTHGIIAGEESQQEQGVE